MKYFKLNIRQWLLLGLPLVAIWLSGCAAPKAISSPPVPATSMAAEQASQHRAQRTKDSGSLWSDNSTLGTMFINAKARRVGDIVTIKIVETSSAKNKASTDTDRNTSAAVGLENFFNLEEEFSTSDKFFNPFSPVKSTYASQFEGKGSTTRSGALTAYITARVVQVMPNGNFMIEGNREVRVNHENQVITLTGLVRPRDISADNVIQSTYIANAKISYSGSGIVNDQQRPGWLVRILDKVWPF